LEKYVLAFFREVLGVTPRTEALSNSVTFTRPVEEAKMRIRRLTHPLYALGGPREQHIR
jgi:hypothetical protein